jgi:hypothetical protein
MKTRKDEITKRRKDEKTKTKKDENPEKDEKNKSKRKMTENSKNNEKAKKTKTKEKDDDLPKRRQSKRRKAFVRLLPLTGIHRWLCRVSPLTDKKTTTHLLFSSFCISQNIFFLLS